MANWKKVLVSGSAIEGSSLLINGFVTMSATLPTSTDSTDLVLVQAAGGQIETRLQSDIQGVTTAVFEITGSDTSNDTFDATGDQLVFAGDVSTAVSATSGKTTLTLNTPSGTISGSQQITDLGFSTTSDITDLETSVTALNAASGSYLISASVIGTANEVEVTGNGDQGIQIGLPDDVTITNNLTVTNDLTADSLTLTGLSLIDNNAAVISGSNIFGSDLTDTHDFTGSIDITGSITISDLTQNNTVGILDLVAVDSNGLFVNAGTAVQAQISGAISNTNAEVDALEASASLGIYISSSGNGAFNVPLTHTASFAASGNGLTLDLSSNTVTYSITPADVLSGIGVISGSAQIAELGAGIVSSSAQITIDATNLPDGVTSGSYTSTEQGIINFPGQGDLSIFGLTAGANPTFGLVTATDLVVTGTTTTVNTTNLNIEDQFILINSGALTPGGQSPDDSDKDGGLIVDFGGGSGSAFFYNADSKAWAVKGTDHESVDQADFLGYNTVASNDSDLAIPDYIVSVVTQAASDPTQGTAPTYGNSTTFTDHGTMHVNRSTGDIWIYS